MRYKHDTRFGFSPRHVIVGLAVVVSILRLGGAGGDNWVGRRRVLVSVFSCHELGLVVGSDSCGG